MDTSNLIQTILIYALPVLFAITVHEAAHGYAARHFGDNTAYMMGRITLNPAKHIDPVGTILMPLLLYFATSGAFLFGYAKPVPVRFGRLRDPRWHGMWVALAGPAMAATLDREELRVGLGVDDPPFAYVGDTDTTTALFGGAQVGQRAAGYPPGVGAEHLPQSADHDRGVTGPQVVRAGTGARMFARAGGAGRGARTRRDRHGRRRHSRHDLRADRPGEERELDLAQRAAAARGPRA